MSEPKINDVLKAFAQYFECDTPFKDMNSKVYRLLKHVDILPKRLTVKPRSQLFHARAVHHTSPTKQFSKSGILSCARYDGVDSFTQCDQHASFLIPIKLEPETLVYSAKKIYQECIKFDIHFSERGRWGSDCDTILNRIKTEDEHIIKFDERLIPPEFSGIFKTSRKV